MQTLEQVLIELAESGFCSIIVPPWNPGDPAPPTVRRPSDVVAAAPPQILQLAVTKPDYFQAAGDLDPQAITTVGWTSLELEGQPPAHYGVVHFRSAVLGWVHRRAIRTVTEAAEEAGARLSEAELTKLLEDDKAAMIKHVEARIGGSLSDEEIEDIVKLWFSVTKAP